MAERTHHRWRTHVSPTLRTRRTRTAGLALVVVSTPALALAAPGNPGNPRYSEGAEGAGDPYFPLAGNGGTDVLHYDLDLDYTPPLPAPAPIEGQLDGVATIDLVATQDLDQFNLDLRGLTVSEVTVGGKSMSFTQTENELVITPRPKLKTGKQVQVVVTYGGTTTRPTDIEGALYGWLPPGMARWLSASPTARRRGSR